MTAKGMQLQLEEAVARIRPRDKVICGFANGQPIGLLEALGERNDLEELLLYAGILARPYKLLANEKVRVISGFFGPIEREVRKAGGRVEFMPRSFRGLEQLALRLKPRVVLAVTTPPDEEGFLNFGLHCEAVYRPFVEAARDPDRLAIVEVNPQMPRIEGLPEFGGNRIHISEVDGWVEQDRELIALPPEAATAEDRMIAERVVSLVGEGATLQFGIGAIPDQIARLLAAGSKGNFGIHTEMINDGVMHLHRAGKVKNEKGLHDGYTIATFALGSAELYRWLDGNPEVRMLPITQVNDPALTRRLQRFVSINGALAIDLAGQVCADHVRGRQHSGIGGHESFVIGAGEAEGGNSVLCLKSIAMQGERLSTIVARLADSAKVTTPRHHVQWVVTEHGAVDLSVLSDIERARALIEIAHPDFRAELQRSLAGA